ncbi:MAG TPA: SurA N-terminal domain-containing protein [Balneolaceae bacterium]|nr:SurA N-terminal domain-containing protein [Balneolaceae bacterium]
MRKSTGVILWVLIFSFGLLWVLADTNFFNVIERGPRSLGSVNGEKISLKEYNNRVNYYTEQYSRQTGESSTPEIRAQYQQQAWNDLVTSKLLQQKMDQLGIKVTDQEVVNMITGKNPDPFIKQQFQKKDGTIDRVALQSAIQAPENKQLWINVEKQMRQKKRQQKMSNYLQSAMEVSKFEVEQQYLRNNTVADISFIRFPYADVDTSEISITNADLQNYYDSHQDKYKRKESYRFNYVGFDKTPTKEDTMRTINEMKDLRSDFAKAEDDSAFFNRYQSTTPYNPKSVEKDQVRDIFKPVLDLKKNEVSQIIQDQGRIYLLKKLDETSGEVKFEVFSMDIKADPVATIDKRSQTADDFSYYAKESGFQKEAQRRNLEIKNAFATKGNNFISGIGQSRQIMSFLETAEEGKISDPIELSNQFVVIKVTQVTPAGVRPFDDVKNQIRTVVMNTKRKQKELERVNKLASENNNLQAIAKAAGKEVQNVESLSKSANSIEGAGREPKVVGAVFGLKEGEQSNAVEGTSAAFIIKVNKLQKADLSNLTSAQRQQIRQQLQQQKTAAFMNTWIDQLKKEADIVDNRAKLLRRS